jgi:hypothetical protein
MKSGLGAGSFEAGDSKRFRRAERAGGPHALRGRPARCPGEDRRGERVRIPAGQVYCREATATGIGRHGHDVGANGFPSAWRGPAALNPAGLLNEYPGSSSMPATDARVPALVAFRVFPRTK